MKKLFTVLAIVFLLATSASALTVTMIGVNAWGGSYIAGQAQIDPMSRADVVTILGTPTKSYGFADVWINHDQIYIGYYDIHGQPVSVVLLPPVSW